MTRSSRWLWLILAAAVLAAGCGGGKGGKPSGGVITLTGAGATFPYPLYSKWFDEYGKVSPQVRINYQSIGSGGGIQQLKAGTVDFGASDAPLSGEEQKAMPGQVRQIPTVAGAVAVAYNLPGVKRRLRLDGETLTAIYLGEIKQWNDPRITKLNPGAKLPKLAVAVAHRSDGSGTSYIFTNYLAAVSKTWRDRVGAGKSVNWPVGIGGKGNEGVAGVIKQTPGAIGYVELAYAVQNKLAYAQIRNSAGKFVTPTIASTTAAAQGAVWDMMRVAEATDLRRSFVNSPEKDAYPIAGFTYLLVYRNQTDQAKGKALAQFLHWAIHDGQRFAAPLLYAPLPVGAVEENNRAIHSLLFGVGARHAVPPR